jgi:O-antigen/teichoic acid export membrane protein
MGTVRRVVRNFLSVSFAEVILRGITFLVIVYLARILAPANFGKIGFAQAVIAYFLLPVNLGLTTLGVREVARNKDDIDKYASNIVTLRLMLALFSFCSLLVLVTFIHLSYEIKYLILVYGLTLFSSALLTEWLFQGIEKMQFMGIARVLDKLLYGVLIFLLIRSSQELLLIPYLWLAGSLMATGFLIFVFVRRFGKLRLRFNFSFWKSLMRRALPMGAAAIMIQVYYNFDVVMLGFIKGDKVVGWYSAAYKLILLIWGFIPIFVNAVFPLMSRYYKESQEKLRTLISSTTRLLSTVALPLGIGGTILARPIMGFFYGEKFNPGIIGFQVLIWSVVIICIRCIYEHSFLACNLEKRFLWGVSLGALTNIGLNIILIPHFSLKGAAVATVISELVFSAYLLSYFQVISRRQIMKYPLKPLLAAVLMGFVVYYARNLNLGLSIPLGILTYSVFIILLKGVTFEEIGRLKEEILAKR